MVRLEPRGFLDIDGLRLEYTLDGVPPSSAPVIVLLHEGLGCAGLWGDFRAALARAGGCGVFACSREGYGASDPVPLPRPLDYMQRHAREVLPRVIDAIGADRVVLAGHSDGASIAAVYAGEFDDPRLRGVALIAPHFFVEDFALAEIAKAKTAWETTDLRAKLARWHARVDIAFRGWNDAWLDRDFPAAFDIRALAPRIRVPVLAIQGAEDQYGTLAQIDVVEHGDDPRRRRLILPGVKHAPHREAAQATVAAIADFAREVVESDS